jgi:protein involved in polysaccharide export with SLBB domain
MHRRTILSAAFALPFAARGLAACGHVDREPITPTARPTATFSDIGYADWSDQEPDYRFYPGDEVEITVPSASRIEQVRGGPTGRPRRFAADRSGDGGRPHDRRIGSSITQAYSSQLLRPQVQVSIKATAPLKVFVGGEVGNPGVYDMAGDGDALRAVIQAGGFKTSAKRTSVVIIRAAPTVGPCCARRTC